MDGGIGVYDGYVIGVVVGWDCDDIGCVCLGDIDVCEYDIRMYVF